MPIDLRSKMSGGGGYEVGKCYIYQQVTPSSTGEIISITATNPLKRVRLESLVADGVVVEILRDGVQLLSGKLKINSAGGNDTFSISQVGAMTQATNSTYVQSMNVISDVVANEIKVNAISGLGTVYFTYSEEA